MTCPACQREVQEERTDCPYCGIVFAKWKGRKLQPAVDALPSDMGSEQTEENDFSLPPLTQIERDDLVTITSYKSDDQATLRMLTQKDRTALQPAGIHTVVWIEEPRRREWDDDRPRATVSVPRKHLLAAKVVLDLHKEHLFLYQLASQPVLFRQKLLIDAMSFVADEHGRFQHALFPRPILAWYQTCANLTQQQMQTALSKAPQAYRSSALLAALHFGVVGGILFSGGYWGEKFLLGIFGEDLGNDLAWGGILLGGMCLLGSLYSLWSFLSSEK